MDLRIMKYAKLKYLGLAACIAGAGLLTYFKFTSVSPDLKTEVSQVSSPAVFGPGNFPAADVPINIGLNESISTDTSAPGDIAISSDQRLILNRALRDVYEYFLVGGHPGTMPDHREKLVAHLKNILPPAALKEAAQIVDKYIAYLEALPSIFQENAPQNSGQEAMPSALDPDRLAELYAQRSRLRQTILGIELAKIWFGEEEAEEQRDIEALRNNKPLDTAQLDPAQQGLKKLALMQSKGASVSEQRREIASRFGEEAAARFDGYVNNENQWKSRYEDYRLAADDIVQQLSHDSAELEKRLAALRAQKFALQSEQARAQAFDIIAAPVK